MAEKTVVVKGGGSNLYYISDYKNEFFAYKGSASIFGGKTHIGTARSLEDALAIIKSHSGRQIEKIY